MSASVPAAALLARYSEAVEKLGAEFTSAHLLDTLLLRDAIEQEISEGTIRDRASVEEIRRIDDQLRGFDRTRLSEHRATLIQWRRTLLPAAEAWWWFMDRALGGKAERVERGILVACVILFPFSLGVAIELARLYSVDGVGLESLLPIAATFLGSFSLGGILSLSFRDRWTALLEDLGLDARWRAAGTFLVFGLLIVIVGLWFLRPWMSGLLNARGRTDLKAQQLSVAQTDFERAVRFDPRNSTAHFNLGRVYEDLLQDDKATTEYLIAYGAGLDLAGDNLSHLYLLHGDYDRAAFILQKLVANRSPHDHDPNLHYGLLKNLAWARLGQHRVREAEALLEQAAGVDPERAEGHCLLAKTLSELKDPHTADEWRNCMTLTWPDANDPARDRWLGEAKSYLAGTSQ